MAKSTKWLLRLQSRPVNETYKANMMALKNKDRDLFNMIAALPENKNYQLFRDNAKTPYNLVLMDRNIAYYDLFDSIGAMEKEVDNLDLKNSRIAVFFGMGLGYELMYFKNNYAGRSPTDYFLVIEKDPYIFRKALEATDLTSVISKANVSFAVGKDEVSFDSFYRAYIDVSNRLRRLKSMKFISTNASLSIYKEYYQNIVEIFKKTSVFVLHFYGNSPEDSLTGEKHMFLNIRNIAENPGINLLYGAFRGKPAVVCASGPSLTKELPILKDFKDKALIITAESTFPGLSAAGIYPHIICTLERDDVPERRFDKYNPEELKNTYLAAVPVIAPKMYESYAGPILNVYRNFNHFKWLPFDRGTLAIQKSSANMAFKLAHMLGCEPIILLGQDLCYDRETGKTHIAEHSSGGDFELIKRIGQREVMANDGVMTKTNDAWFDFLQGYNVDVEEYGKEVINCSEKGARIERTKYMPFKEAAEKYLKKDFDTLSIIKEIISERFSRDDIKDNILKLDEKLKKADEDLADMLGHCDEAVKLIEQYVEEFSGISEQQGIPPGKISQLDEASKKIVQMKGKLVSGGETFNALVMHVVQSYYINFDINWYEKMGSYDDAPSRKLYTIKSHHSFFKAMSVMITLVKDETDKAAKDLEEVKKKYI